MKKLLLILISTMFLLVSNNTFADTQNTEKRECTQVCVKWEERRDCRPDPINPGKQICAVYHVCVQYEEKCD